MLINWTGIDVQAELALKGSPHLRPVQRPSMASQASPMQKAMLNRQQQVRQRPVVAPPIQTVNQTPRGGGPHNFAGSPTAQPTPPSQHSSPSTARSPGFALQGGMTSPGSDLQAQHVQQRSMTSSQHQSFPSQPRTHMRNLQGHRNPAGVVSQSNYYPASFQKHYDQLGKLTHFLNSFPACGALFVLG